MSKIDQIVQLMRTLTLAQVRKQLEHDEKQAQDRFEALVKFFEEAKTKQR